MMNPEQQPNYKSAPSFARVAMLTALASVFSASAAEAALPYCDPRTPIADPALVHLSDGQDVELVCIVDGDTVHGKVEGNEFSIRYLGVDCPESRENDKCMEQGKAVCDEEIERGKVAKEWLRSFLTESRIRVHAPFMNKYKKGHQGRKMLYGEFKGKDIGWESIVQGKCCANRYYSHRLKEQYEKNPKYICPERIKK